jgi:hypothetical protein
MPNLNQVDANEIAPFLYQGSAPADGDHLAKAGFHLVILCANEYQPPKEQFLGGIDVIHAPNDDNPSRAPTRQELQLAIAAAKQAAERVRDGKHVLVTCMAGLNRSGLVSALTLHMLFGWAGAQCASHVQSKRHHALCNPQFVKVLSTLRPKPPRSIHQARRCDVRQAEDRPLTQSVPCTWRRD